jgi:hypothetical protein
MSLDPSYVTRLHTLLERHNNEHTNGRYTRFYVAEAKALKRLLEVFDAMLLAQAKPETPIANSERAVWPFPSHDHREPGRK